MRLDSSLKKKKGLLFPNGNSISLEINPVSCNFTLQEEKSVHSRKSLDLTIVSLPKHHKENRKIVNVWTEVAMAHLSMLFKRRFLPTWPLVNSLARSILLPQKAHIRGNVNALVLQKIKLAFGILSSFNWEKMYANKMQEHDSS